MRAVLFALLLPTVVVAQTPAELAARRREDALKSVAFDVRVAGKQPATVRLVFDGPKVRYERNMTDPKRRWLSANDGGRAKSLVLWDDAGTGASAGNIEKPSEGVSLSEDLVPLTFAARGLSPLHCPIPADTLTPAGSEEVRGRVCGVYTGAVNRTPATLWLDPVAGNTVRRAQLGGKTVDVEASNANPAGVWLPTSYTFTRPVGGGQPPLVAEYVVERVAIGAPLPADEFDPPWPPGLPVYDLRTGEMFVTDADGVPQVPPDRVMWGWVRRLLWVPVLLVVVPLVVIGWRGIRRSRSNRREAA